MVVSFSSDEITGIISLGGAESLMGSFETEKVILRLLNEDALSCLRELFGRSCSVSSGLTLATVQFLDTSSVFGLLPFQSLSLKFLISSLEGKNLPVMT